MTLTDRFDRALAYAATAHGGQVRKHTEIPYLSHLLIVAGLVLEFGGDENQAIGGLLHDAVEDAGGLPRLEDIKSRFGRTVAEIVLACTDADTLPKPPWPERKREYLTHLATTSPGARLVSAADKLANVRAILKDQATIGSKIWERFKGGQAGTLWYYTALSEEFNRGGPVEIARELYRAVTDLQRLVDCRCCMAGTNPFGPRGCPECGHVFEGIGWGGIDGHWRYNHEDITPYEAFWSSLCLQHRVFQPVVEGEGSR